MVYLPDAVFREVMDFLKPRPNPAFCIDRVCDLKTMCRERGLRVGGNKLDLINRLLEDGCYARPCFWDETQKGAKVRPMLTFRTALHTKEGWEAFTAEIRAQLESTCPHAVKHYGDNGRWSEESVYRGFSMLMYLECDWAAARALYERHMPLCRLAAKAFDRRFSAVVWHRRPNHRVSAPLHLLRYPAWVRRTLDDARPELRTLWISRGRYGLG